MAVYKHDRFLEQSAHRAFDIPTPRGGIAVFNGIYRCTLCGQEIVSSIGGALPEQCPRPHATPETAFDWQLVIAAN